MHTCLAQTAFYNNISNTYLDKNIATSTNFASDVTFVSTLRALLFPRTKVENKEEFLFPTLKVKTCISPKNGLEGSITSYLNTEGQENTLYIIGAAYNIVSDDFEDRLRTLFVEKFEYKEIEKVTQFFKSAFNVWCFVNEPLHSTIVVCPRMDILMYHNIQAAIPIMLPWYFKNKSIVKDSLEHKLLKSISSGDNETYKETLDSLYYEYNLEEYCEKEVLQDFESGIIISEIENRKDEISALKDTINRRNDEVKYLINDLKEKEIYLLGLCEKRHEAQNNELTDFFLANRSLKLRSFGANTLEFAVTTELDSYDKDLIERVISKEDGDIYFINRSFNKEDLKLLLTEIFIKETLTINVSGVFQFRDLRYIRAVENVAVSPICLPNPHLYHYHCLGSYEPIINELLSDNNYIGAISQCIGACKSLNFADSMVITRFIEDLTQRRKNESFIVTPTCEILTPLEAIKYIKENTSEVNENE